MSLIHPAPPYCKGVDGDGICIAIPETGYIADPGTCKACALSGGFGLVNVTRGADGEVIEDQEEAKRIRGLGDVVEKLTEATGIKKLVDKLAPGGCGCKKRKQKLNRILPAITSTVVIPACNEGEEVQATVESFREAGANRFLVVDDASTDGSCWDIPGARVIRNTEARGVARCRNQGAHRGRGDVLVFTDGHCRFDGDFHELVRVAHERQCVAIAPCSGMEGGAQAFGASLALTHDLDGGKRHRSGFEYFTNPSAHSGHPVGSLYGSVYAVPRELFHKMGGWPDTPGYGYNEQAMSLQCRILGVPMIPVAAAPIRHKFRKGSEVPYKAPRNSIWMNKVRVHRILFTEDEFMGYWWPELCKDKDADKKRGEKAANEPEVLEAHRKHMQARERFGVDQGHTDIGQEWKRPRVVAAIALAPRLFPMWEKCLLENAKRVDGLVILLDGHKLQARMISRLRTLLGDKLLKHRVTFNRWNRWGWRNELMQMVRRLDQAPDIVLTPDQDETFQEGLEKDLMRWWSLDPATRPGGMMFDYEMVTGDGAEVDKYPGARHMKAFIWRGDLTYHTGADQSYQGFAKVYQYAGPGQQINARSKVRHWCMYDAAMRAEKENHLHL